MHKPYEHLEYLKEIVFRNAISELEVPSDYTVTHFIAREGYITHFVVEVSKAGEWLLSRKVSVSDLDTNNDYAITTTEELESPFKYTLTKRNTTLRYREDSSDYRPGTMFSNVIAAPINAEALAVVLGYLKKANDLNTKWFGDKALVVLYNQRHGGEPEWRFKITSIDGAITYCSSLDPNTADGHTYRMLVYAVNEAEQRGKIAGITHAIEQQVKRITQESFYNSRVNIHVLPNETQKILREQL